VRPVTRYDSISEIAQGGIAVALPVEKELLEQDIWTEYRATPEELERLRSQVRPMRPVVELIGGPSEPATAEEIADLEAWLAEREEERSQGSSRLQARTSQKGQSPL
jgi:hypothetical protein